MDFPVYYKIYYSERDNVMTVVCMQSFDEDDYYQYRFFKDENGDPYRFDDEEDAIKFLNEKFKTEYIDPEYLRDDNFFGKMLKG